MQDSLERQALEETLKGERAGSANIRALSHYVMLKQAGLMIEREREQGLIGDDTFSYWERQKLILEVEIEQQYFTDFSVSWFQQVWVLIS